jgi:hypothetical protein
MTGLVVTPFGVAIILADIAMMLRRLHAQRETQLAQQRAYHAQQLHMLASIATSISMQLGGQVGALGARIEGAMTGEAPGVRPEEKA